jgi:hypothetical protein
MKMSCEKRTRRMKSIRVIPVTKKENTNPIHKQFLQPFLHSINIRGNPREGYPLLQNCP